MVSCFVLRVSRPTGARIDARDGNVATDGWLATSSVPATDLARQFADEPVAAIIYTDIAADGMLCGPNLAAMQEMRRDEFARRCFWWRAYRRRRRPTRGAPSGRMCHWTRIVRRQVHRA